MTKTELITIGFDFTQKNLPTLDILINDSYLTEIQEYNYENIIKALDGLNDIILEYSKIAEEIAINQCIYYYYFRENFLTSTGSRYNNAFELSRFLWYISIEKDEFLQDIKETLNTYL